jgi:excisionase family DNA binding protein
MDIPDDKPLYTLTVGEFRTLASQIVFQALNEHHSVPGITSSSVEPKEDAHFTIKELTKFLHCSRMSIHNYKKLGLPFYRLGRKILFKKDEVVAFMRRCIGRDVLRNSETK